MKRLCLIAALAALAASAAYAAPDAPADLYKEGTALVGQGKYAEAVEVLRKEVSAHPTNTKAYMYLATAYEKLNQWSDAAAAWDKFVKLTESVDERAFGEKRGRECRDRASGKAPVDTAQETTETAEPASEYSRFERQEPVLSTLKTKHFIVMAKNRALLEEAAKQAERHLDHIRNIFLFGREWSHTITIRIYKDHTNYVIEAGMPQWSGGGYSVRPDGAGGELLGIDLFALDPKGKFIPDLLTKILPHEMTHAVLHEYFGQRAFGSLPRAINEGLAMYSEEGTQVFYERELADAVKRGVYFKLNDLFQMTNYPSNVGLFYAESASATRYLIEHLKASEFQSFLEELKRGQSVNSALQTALARTGDLLTPMETNWLEMMKQKAVEYAKNPPPKTPATKTSTKPPPKTEAKTETKPPSTDTKTEPYDPQKNEKKTPSDDDEKDVIVEVK